MNEAAIDLFQLLVQVGARPGEDFSCDVEQQAYRLNRRCGDLLRAAYPDVDWEELLGVPYEAVQTAIAQLHAQLGCPFVDRLIAQMRRRLTTLPDAEAAGYVQAILVGVEAATGLALYPLLVEQLDMAAQARLEWLLRQETVVISGAACLLDLLQAAGGTAADYTLSGDDLWLTEAGWQRLSQVWDGECCLTQAPPLPRSL